MSAKVFELIVGDESTAEVREVVLSILRREGLYGPNLLYRGFSRNLLNHVLYYGSEDQSDRFIYAGSEEWLSVDPDPQWRNPLTYARHGDNRGFAVYYGDKLERAGVDCFRVPEARIARASCLAAIFIFDVAR